MGDCYDDDGEKLVLAAGRGDVTDVRRFVRGSTLSYEDGWGRTALVSASYLGNVEVPAPQFTLYLPSSGHRKAM